MNIDRNTPVWQITVGDLADYLKSNGVSSKEEAIIVEETKEYVYGIDGLARIIGCSKSHASRLKAKGLFDEAIIQRGRKIIINKEKAIELFNRKE